MMPRDVSRPLLPPRALALLLVLGSVGLAVTPRAAPTDAQVVVPPTVLTVVAPTDAPPEPTQPPPTIVPSPAPTRVPDDRDDDADRPEAPPAPPVTGEADRATAEASPTRTRRPTRTPRTTPSPTPTAMVAGGLQLTLTSDPLQLVSAGRAELLVRLANRSGLRAANLTLQIVLPDSVLVDGIDAGPGLVGRSGQYVRWYLPGLDPGRTEVLRLAGLVSRAPAEGVSLCALLLSGGSAIEHCSVLPVVPGEVGAAIAATEAPPTDAVPMVLETGRALDLGALGWGVLLLGLGALGVAIGLRRRGS